ncbi:hypothetical protein FDP41_010440 [Naegleria fowleri]|uniref:Cytochrome P450 n=1 Tax=Naegleria fowleri TaxID=5763 RepID=A0A6A5CDE6_NAEFO|nr:uncharacterized protein FDP41_010440 [Naegleria fowleri]KAF0983375.1 hypothetical protein FDP41_010440 [Naegleria fowleri]
MPGPKGLPFIGNLLDMTRASKNIQGFFTQCVKEHGEVVKLTALNNKMVILSNPELFKELAKLDEGRITMEVLRKVKVDTGMMMIPVENYNHENWQDVRAVLNVAMRPDVADKVVLPQLSELGSDFVKSLINNLETIVNDQHGTEEGY